MEKAELKDGRTQVNRYDAEGLRHEMEENGQLVQFLCSGKESWQKQKAMATSSATSEA